MKQEHCTEQYRIQDPAHFNTELPEKLRGVSKVVLQVDTTWKDNADDFVMPELLVEGLVLKHNVNDYPDPIPYEQSSQFFIDNAHKFDNTQSVFVTLQFKLGLHDDGENMIDLLLKSILCGRLGRFKFKVYIYKTMGDGIAPSMVFSTLNLLENVNNIIGFRFETDYITLDCKFEYDEVIKFNIPIEISWLREDLEELHFGQKVKICDDFSHLYFPKLTTVGFECKDQVASYNFGIFLSRHGTTVENLTLRNFSCPTYNYQHLTVLKNVTLLGYCHQGNSRELLYYATHVKSLSLFRRLYLEHSHIPALSNLKEFTFSKDIEREPKGPTNEVISELSKGHSVVVKEIPFNLRHRFVYKYSTRLHHSLERYSINKREPIPHNSFKH